MLFIHVVLCLLNKPFKLFCALSEFLRIILLKNAPVKVICLILIKFTIYNDCSWYNLAFSPIQDTYTQTTKQARFQKPSAKYQQEYKHTRTHTARLCTRSIPPTHRRQLSMKCNNQTKHPQPPQYYIYHTKQQEQQQPARTQKRIASIHHIHIIYNTIDTNQITQLMCFCEYERNVATLFF